MLTRLALATIATTCVATSQAAQLVGPVVDASTIIRSTAGFSGASLFGGGCRDQQGGYWTCAQVNGDWFAVRINTGNQVTGFVNTGVFGTAVQGMTYDALRDNVWIQWSYAQLFGNRIRVVDTATATVIATPFPSPTYSRGLAWDGANRIYVPDSAIHYNAATFATASNAGVMTPTITHGIAFDPTSGRFWGGSFSAADPAGIVERSIQQHPAPGASMPTELSFATNPASPSGSRGGNLAGMDAWQDPATGEWLGVFCQRLSNGDVKLYTARFSVSTGGNCGGPSFSAGPGVVQDQLYASGANLASFAWLIVSFNHSSFTAPIFAPGCTVEIDPVGATIFGAYLPDFNGNVSVNEPVPISPALQELPLYYQWVTLDLAGNLLLSEGRSAAIKQF
jgi:hypothetical protein